LELAIVPGDRLGEGADRERVPCGDDLAVALEDVGRNLAGLLVDQRIDRLLT